MNTTRELLEQALEALEKCLVYMETPLEKRFVQPYVETEDCMQAIREHLSVQETARPEPEKNYIEKAIDAVVERIHNDKDQL